MDNSEGLTAQHWMLTGKRNDRPLPDVVVRRWAFFKKHARQSMRSYVTAEIVTVVSAAAVPVLASLRCDLSLTAAAGAIVLIATTVRTVFRFHDDWIDFARLRIDLEREAAAFLYNVRPYDTDDDEAVRLLVVRSDDLADAMRVRRVARRRQLGSGASPGKIGPSSIGPTPTS